jgi:CMP-N-acetylneuraminic acid synthetase
MILVIPIFPTTPEEKSLLWRPIDGTVFLDFSLLRFSQTTLPGVDEVSVITNEPSLVRRVSRLGFRNHILNNGITENSDFLPFGASAAVQWLEQNTAKKEAIIADYRSPLLSWKTIEKALTKYRLSDTELVLSFVPMEDHPCQWESYFRIMDLDLACSSTQMRHKQAVDSCRISTEALYRSVWRDDQNPGPHQSLLNSDMYGDEKTFLIDDGERTSLYLRNDAIAHGLILRVWPIRGDGHMETEPIDIHVRDHSRYEHFSPVADANQFLGPLYEFSPSQDIRAVITAHLLCCDKGEADLVEPLRTRDRLWEIEETNGQRINSESRSIISGRQAFPRVYSLHRAFAIGSLNALKNADQLLSRGHLSGFQISRVEAVSLNTELDLLKILAFRRKQTRRSQLSQSVTLNNTNGSTCSFHRKPGKPVHQMKTVCQTSSFKADMLHSINEINRDLENIQKDRSEKNIENLRERIDRLRYRVLHKISLCFELQTTRLQNGTGSKLNDLTDFTHLTYANLVSILKTLLETITSFQDYIDNLEKVCLPDNRLAPYVGFDLNDRSGGYLRCVMDDTAFQDQSGFVATLETERQRGEDSWYDSQFIPRILTADQSMNLFVSAFGVSRQSPQLRIIDLPNRVSRTLRTDRQYSGIWFDQEEEVLFALRYLLDGRKNLAMERLDREGRIMQSVPMSTFGRHQTVLPSRLAGNDSSNLYLMDMDPTNNHILKLDKSTLKPVDNIRIPLMNHLSNFKIIKNSLFLIFKRLQTIAVYDLNTAHLEWFSSCNFGYPIDILTGPDNIGYFLLRTKSPVNSFTECDPHGIIRIDKDFGVVSDHWLDSCRISDSIHLESDMECIVLADIKNGLRILSFSSETD